MEQLLEQKYNFWSPVKDYKRETEQGTEVLSKKVQIVRDIYELFHETNLQEVRVEELKIQTEQQEGFLINSYRLELAKLKSMKKDCELASIILQYLTSLSDEDLENVII